MENNIETKNPEGLSIYRASAGSGKTFLLTFHYLLLLFRSPEKYREILAVTFTNKATAEMKSRILRELRKIATGEDSVYLSFLEINFFDQEIQTSAHHLYRSILHDYSRFAITTIDKFVQQIIRSFAYEIGLNAGYKLELNQELVKEALAEKMYQQADTDKHLLKWLIALAKDRLEDGRSWNFTNEMMTLASEIFKEPFHEFEQKINALQEPEKIFDQLSSKLAIQKNIFEKQIKEFGARGLKILQQHQLAITDFAYGNSGFANWFMQADKEKIAAPGKRFHDAIDTRANWTAKKTSNEINSSVDIIYPALNKLMRDIIDYWNLHYTGYCTAQAIAQNFYMLNLLRVMALQLSAYREENNALLISDTHALLRALTKENNAPYILEKTGNRYQHFLIDEFQDTSVFQWENFLPLIQNSLAEGNFNMLVGDVKQAIYRWRNGDWRLLLKNVKEDIGAQNVTEYALQHNFRSAINIIHFNNFLFYHAPKILQQQFNICLQDADELLQEQLAKQSFSSLIEQAYTDSYQYPPDAIIPGGNIHVRFMPVSANKISTRKKEAREEINKELPQIIESLIREKNYQPGQITLLARSNTDARQIIDLLMHHQTVEGALQYAIISSEALLVAAGRSVQLLLAALGVLNDAQNTLLWGQLIYLHNQVNDLNVPLQKCFDIFADDGGKKLLPENFLLTHEKLKGLTLSELVENLISIFHLHDKPDQIPYLLAFRDAVAGFNRGGEQNLADFLIWWKEEGIKLPVQISSNQNAVEVMTIHKCKGLAFDVVIIPYCDWELSNSQSTQLWCDATRTSFPEIEMLPLRMKKELAQSQFAFSYFEELLFQYMDGLNLLYVALTRARQELIVMAPAQFPEKNAVNSIAGDLILNSLLSTANLAEEKTWRNFSLDFSQENNSLFIYENAQQPAEKNNDELIYLSTYPQFNWQQKINTTTSNSWWNDNENENAGAQERRFGQLMHRALASIKNENELPALLQNWVMEGLLNGDEKAKIITQLQSIFQDKMMQQWFGSKYEAMNERELLTPQAGRFRPDKVLLDEEETIVIDFKFTKEKSTAHHHQLQNYKQLLQQMDYPNIKAYLYYGLLHEAEEV